MVLSDAVWSVCAMWLALAIDRCLREPPVAVHPVAWMGRALSWCGQRVAPVRPSPRDLAAFARGTLAWCGGALVVVMVAWGVERVLRLLPVPMAVLGLGLVLKPMLAWRMLREEVVAVERALEASMDDGRERLSRLVSRDVATLAPSQVREAAIETLAENLNDSVVAPLFWFALLGLPGAALYRFANTADAMWGYPGMREGRYWQWAGKWAARADDVLSWVPARLTAGLLAVAGGLADPRRLLREAAKTPSPNGGWPMSAMALVLGTRLGKPGVYILNPDARAPLPQDTLRAVGLGTRVVVAVAVLLAPMTVVMAVARGGAG
ncbi:MAG: adenosylcobinamide-phosphate synthase CbiB [Hydrogenophaga sp.]